MAVLRAATIAFLNHQQRRVGICGGRAIQRIRCFSATPPSLTIKVAAIAGSLRQGSTNQGLIRAAIELSKDIPGLEIEQLHISQLPLLNTDLEVDDHFPDTIEKFRAKVLQADSILFASPEYNYSMTGVLKNAIDWASRKSNCWADKPAAIMSAGGGMGGARSQYHLRQTGVYLDLHFLNKPELFVRSFEPPSKFDSNGNLVHEDTRVRLRDLLFALQKWTLRLQLK